MIVLYCRRVYQRSSAGCWPVVGTVWFGCRMHTDCGGPGTGDLACGVGVATGARTWGCCFGDVEVQVKPGVSLT